MSFYGFDLERAHRVGTLRRLLALLLLGVALPWPAPADGAPISLERLREALADQALSAEQLIATLQERGVDFRLTSDLERDLRDRGADDIVIRAVRQNYRSPLPAGPAVRDDLLRALEAAAPLRDLAEHIRRYGVDASLDPAALDALRAAGASAEILRLVAERWLETSRPDGSLEQIEAILAAGAASHLLASRLAYAPLQFTLDREIAARLENAGADRAFLADLARRGLEADAGAPLELAKLEFYLELDVEPLRLARGLAARGVAFTVDPAALSRLQAAGADTAVHNAVLVAALESADTPLQLDTVVRAAKAGASAQKLRRAIERRKAAFGFEPATTRRLAEEGVGDAARRAVIRSLLEADGYRKLSVEQAFDYDPSAPEGYCDLRIRVAEVVEVVFVDSLILTKALRGRSARDVGSKLSQPLPRELLVVESIQIERRDGRGDYEIVWRPSEDNGYVLRVRIADERRGADRVHLHLSWRRGVAD